MNSASIVDSIIKSSASQKIVLFCFGALYVPVRFWMEGTYVRNS